MSDHISFDIQTEIIKRLVVKSLFRFRSVSKSWKSLIDSPKFVASRIQMHRLLVWYWKRSTFTLISFVDDDDTLLFGQTIVPLLPTEVHIYKILGSSHGLFCLCCLHRINDTTDKLMYVIWNPSIRKSVFIEDPQTEIDFYPNVRSVSFGVCPVTCDPKLVIVNIGDLNYWHVEIYTLSSGNWRKISNNVPYGTIYVNSQDAVVVTNMIIYWNATDRHNGNTLVVCFDLTSEEFTLIDIPDFIEHRGYKIFKLGDSLVLLTYQKLGSDNVVCDVWMMNNGVSKTFTKLYNVTLPNMFPNPWVRGFTKSGTIIIEMGDCGKLGGLYVFEPNSERITKIGIEDVENGFSACNYHETLLLLDRS